MYGQDILCGISKGTFEILRKILYPFIKDTMFVQQWNFKSSWI